MVALKKSHPWLDDCAINIRETDNVSGAYHLYSVAALTDNSGAVVERYRYDAYGQRTVLEADGTTVRAASLYGNQIGFTGRYLDKETGLYYFRARYYSGSLGRFIGRDALRYVDGMNLYLAYFVPMKTDPSGNTPQISTTLFRKTPGFCGAYKTAWSFFIDPKTEIGGEVIQHLFIDIDAYDCDTGEKVFNHHTSYFEAGWNVPRNSRMASGNDNNTWDGSGKKTYGSGTIVGSSTFYEGMTKLPKGFNPKGMPPPDNTNAAHPGDTMNLDENSGSGQSTDFRWIKFKWNCCCKKEETQLETSGG